MVEASPEGFLFSVKAHYSLTHEITSPADDARLFVEGIRPFVERGRLAAVLAQFPPSFKPGPDSRDYLLRIREWFGNLAVAVEFRHASWQTIETEALLREAGLALVCVDQPSIGGLLKLDSAVTAPLAYFRFHGRNRAKWYRHREAYERYDYLYSPEEIRELGLAVSAATSSSSRVLVAFNNHYGAKAVLNAVQLRELLTKTRNSEE